jgi:hypothetical protein
MRLAQREVARYRALLPYQASAYGNHTQANMSSFIALGANRPTPMTTMPEVTSEIDRMISGHPLKLCSKPRNNALTHDRQTTRWRLN